MLVLALDQASKQWVLERLLFAERPISVLPFLDITLVWNRGVSYGLFQQSGTGRWVLVLVTLGATVALAAWMLRTPRLRLRLSLALVVGGAVGNLIDRTAFGAVVDFVHLYYGDFSWYVFNVADAAIVFGVVGLLVDGLWPARGGAAQSVEAPAGNAAAAGARDGGGTGGGAPSDP